MRTETQSTDRERWLEARETGIGGSDAAAILGLNPWESAYTLWCRRMGLIGRRKSSDAAVAGRYVESATRKWYEDTTGRVVFSLTQYGGPPADAFSVERIGEIEHLRSRERAWCVGSVDGWTFSPERGWGVLECKAVGDRLRDHWREADGKPCIPPYVNAQVQHYLALTGLQWASVAVLFGGREFGFHDVDRDDEFIAKMIAAESRFWALLQEGTEPDPDGSDSTRDTLAALYPEATGKRIGLPDEALAWDREFVEHRDAEKYHAKMKKAAETKIRAAMGSAEAAVLSSGVEWRSSNVAESHQPAKVRRGFRKFWRREAK